MSELDEDVGEEPKRKGGKGILLALILAVVGGGGGFFVTYTGIVGGTGAEADTETAKAEEELEILDLPPIAFVPLDPLVISINGGSSRYLRFRAEIEVVRGYEEEVAMLKPRILDVLNSYLRAVDPTIFEQTGALIELRAQMLRRIQLVTGNGRVRDLLIAEFVVS